MSCEADDGETEPVLDGQEGEHEANTEDRQSAHSELSTTDYYCYLYTAEPINIDHLHPIIRHSWPTKGIDIPWRTTLVVVRNTKSSYVRSGLYPLERM